MALKPWYKVATPREDLREGKPLDASEFAVHLDQVRNERAPDVYQKPQQFFERTYLTQNLTGLAAEVIRRLSGEKTETSAVFNMTTQFGGGKTHALLLLYHLAKLGPDADKLPGVASLLERAGMPTVPNAETAVFVGTEFDSIDGRGGNDGTPKRMTPWGEIAFQLGGETAFNIVARHDEQLTAPAGDVLRQFLPKDGPCLILLDEVMNYVSRSRKSGMATQFYNFIQNLSEEARGRDNVVLAVSVPSSELEMAAEDQSDHERFKKLLDRLGKAVIMSAEAETSEIIRRRLFEWDNSAVAKDGRVLLSRDAIETCKEYAEMIVKHRQQIPSWFPVDNARAAFEATYPFHPMVLSVFERKWQALPRFQRTRGVLRLLALWVSRAFQEGFKGAQKDLLIGLGTAPLDDSLFRAAMSEQLGEMRLEPMITTDICGKPDSHAIRLDKEAVDTIKKTRLHRKVASAIFFESNGGQAREIASVPEIRLAITEPDIDIGNIETALDALASSCYFLASEHSNYRFSLNPNLNKLLADRRATIQLPKIEERVRTEVQKVFSIGTGTSIERIFFPGKSNDISDRALLTFVILAPDQLQGDEKTAQLVEAMTRECGSSGRTFKNALIWCLPDSTNAIYDEAKKLLAWESIDEQNRSELDKEQQTELDKNIKKAQSSLKECVWRTYKKLMLLSKDNSMRTIDFGLLHSSSAESMLTYILSSLTQAGDISDVISPTFLTKYWPPAFKEWSTKSVREAFFASPQFPRLLKAEAIKDTIARGVSNGILAYVGKASDGDYQPFYFEKSLSAGEVEISEEMFIITKETAENYLSAKATPPPVIEESKEAEKAWSLDGGSMIDEAVAMPAALAVTFTTDDHKSKPITVSPVTASHVELPLGSTVKQLDWTGEIPAQKWMNFYTKVLSKFASSKALKLTISIIIAPEGGISAQKIEETKLALRELGLDDNIGTM